MGAKEAVRAAKEHIADLFQDEGVMDVGLEELDYRDGGPGVWETTIGFRRVWKGPDPVGNPLAVLSGRTSPRTYKIVRVSDQGEVLSLKHRQVSITRRVTVDLDLNLAAITNDPSSALSYWHVHNV